MSAEQLGVRCAIYRGGTSKGVYFRADDLPPPGDERDALLKAVMGSQDLLQIDGLGGSRLVTAKLAIVGPSTRADADVDYTYGIVPPGRGIVVFTSNCGNISAAVGPFAIDSGMVPAREPMTPVRIHNTNTGKILVAHVPVAGGRARVQGDLAIPGVPGTGAEIFMDYSGTTGAKSGRVFPTGSAVDLIALEDGRSITVTLGDVGNPCAFVRASDVGCMGPVLPLPDRIDKDEALIALLMEIRGKAAERLGFVDNWREAETDSPGLPLMVLVAPPHDYNDAQGRPVAKEQSDLQARLVFYNRCHESMAGTGSICIAAMSSVGGTLVHEACGGACEGRVRIGHPLGAMEVVCEPAPGADPREPGFTRLGIPRTARRLMEGNAFVPANLPGIQL